MKRVFKDQMGYDVTVVWPPKRMVSIVPSQTELLYSIGLDEEVVGITKFCVHPEEWFRTKKRVGGTKKLDIEKIAQLHPDLIIGNKEENEEAQVKELMKHYPIWMSDIHNLTHAFDMMNSVGEIVNKSAQAGKLIKQIKQNFAILQTKKIPTRSAAYFIWKKPYMAAGRDTFINSMLNICKLKNVCASLPGRYPELSTGVIKELNPEVILLSSEPYPFSEKHKAEFAELCPNAQLTLVDGEYFSWYGSRLLGAPAYFSKMQKA